MKKRAIILSLLLLLLGLFASCGKTQTPEEKAQQFLSVLIADDAELQQAILDSMSVIGEGVPAPTEDELAAREESAARLEELLHMRFDGLVCPELFGHSAPRTEMLTYWQTLLAHSGAKAAVNECSFTEEGDRLQFEAAVHCMNGDEELDLPLHGEVVFNEDGLIDGYQLYEEEESFTGWLREQGTAVLDEIVKDMLEGQ